MKSFYKIFAAIIMIIILVFLVVNLYLLQEKTWSGRPYRIEVNRIVQKIEQGRLKEIDLSKYNYIVHIEKYQNDKEAFFENTDRDYCIHYINGELYRFDYEFSFLSEKNHLIMIVNMILFLMSFIIIGILIFIQQKILKPFEIFCELPYELSKGNLTIPVKEYKNHFFGKFLWGINLLRETIEQQKQRELALQRDQKTLLLSISHDIKTPLSAIKLYTKALSKGLYKDREKQNEIAENIYAKADEIEKLISQIIQASYEDFLHLEVKQEEFYLSQLIYRISKYYKEKLNLMKINFSIHNDSDCILKGDFDRSIEALQNIIENAIKYGNGSDINITVLEEEDCKLIIVKNNNCTLNPTELPHIFDSFWRGSNVGNHNGSGLGLFICRQIMRKMDGEVFAEIQKETISITAVFRKVI